MQSQLPVLSMSFLSATRGADYDQQAADNVLAAQVNTSCPCFPPVLMNNYQMFEVIPPLDVIPQVARLLVAYFNMTSTAILYDTTFGECGWISQCSMGNN